jgi:hypothetical protein
MAKKTTYTPRLDIVVHSDGEPFYLSACIKSDNLEHAKEIGRKLWNIANEPKLLYIRNQYLEEVFNFKA